MHFRAFFGFTLALVASLFSGVHANAGETPKEPIDTVTPKGPRISFITARGEEIARDSSSSVIPFSRAGNLILVQASVDSIQGNFILDTGAPHLVLNITYFRDYPQHAVEGEQTSMTGSSASIVRTTVKEVTFGAINYYNMEADLANLGHIENTRGVKILGLLGVELFKQCEMIIDYEKNLIYVHYIGRKEEKTYQHEMLKDTEGYRSFPIDITDNRIMVATEMAGKKLKFVIDCAAESNVIDSRLPDKIFDNVEITRRVVLKGVNNRDVDALYGDLKNMKINNQDIGTLPVLITNLANTCFSYAGCVDGILGFDFLSLHKIGFNFVKRKMYIWK